MRPPTGNFMKHLAHNGEWSDQAWLIAVVEADKSGDLSTLATRLRSNSALSKYGRRLIADLLERHKLKRPRGGRRRPLFEGPSDKQANIMAAALAYDEEKHLRKERRDDAIQRLSKEYRCSFDELFNYLKGSGGTARRFGYTRRPPHSR